MRKVKIAPQKGILILTAVLFGIFLLWPLLAILVKSVVEGNSITFSNYTDLLDKKIGNAFLNSTLLSAAAGMIAVVLAFLPAYAVNYTKLHSSIKKAISALMMLPMLLPTITYGFAIIYALGKQGLITQLLGTQIVDIYGVQGLLIGYVIYALPTAFMLISNTMGFIDKRFTIVSRLMGDSRCKCFLRTVLRPLAGTLAVAFIQSFTLCFTDYGIPSALAGNIDLLSVKLYNEMLGSLPDFHAGSAISILMLLPSVINIVLITLLNRYNIRYNKLSPVELTPSFLRDAVWGFLSFLITGCIVCIFSVIFLVPLVEQWPYRMQLSLSHIAGILADGSLRHIFFNSLLIALLSASFGTILAYICALVSSRQGPYQKYGKLPDAIALVANTVPGMVLGVAYLMAFKGSFLHNGLAILVICNIVHFFSTPYLLMKSSLEKLNGSWETTAALMGDSWLKTVLRILTPNSLVSLLEAFRYFFTNAMVTVSAVIFLVSTDTMVMTAKIKELQHFASFNEIFVLSMLILLTNLATSGIIKLVAGFITKRRTS